MEGCPLPHPVLPDHQRIGGNSVPMHLQKCWSDDGFVCIPGVLSRTEIDAHNEIVSSARRLLDDCPDPQDYGDRIGQLHQVYPDLMNATSKPAIVDFLCWAFGEDPVLFGSLQFEKGTEQSPHIDAIFFWPEPAYSMAGVWIALEDIDPDSGPLFYIPGSHRWPFYHSDDVVAERPELRARWSDSGNADDRASLVSEIGNFWTVDFLAMEQERSVSRVVPAIKAGDAVIWHSLLAHGGSPRVNPALSRRSVVYHFFGTNARLYTFEQFMLTARADITNQSPLVMPRSFHNSLEFMKFPQFSTYSEGVERIRSVEEFKQLAGM